MLSHASPQRLRVPATVNASAAAGVIDFMISSDLDPDIILDGVGLKRADVDRSDNRIYLSQFCELFEAAARLAERPNIGLEFGSAFRPEHLGFLGYMAMSAGTLGVGLSSFIRYLPLHQQATMIRMEGYGRDRVSLTYAILDDSIYRRRQDAELSIAVMLNMVRAALGDAWQPDEVHFAHARPPSGAFAHERAFGAPVFFDQADNAVIFERSLLDATMSRRDPMLFDLIRSEFEKTQNGRRVKPDDEMSMVRHEVRRLLADGRCDLTNLARACSIPSWTLKRRLQKLGLSFQMLVTEVRKALAIEYLIDHSLSVTETALALGYSEVSAFSRAFRLWTGMSAREYVARQTAN